MDPVLQKIIDYVMTLGGAGVIVSNFYSRVPYVAEWFDTLSIRAKVVVVAITTLIPVVIATFIGLGGAPLTLPVLFTSAGVWGLNVATSQVYKAYVDSRLAKLSDDKKG